jgi:hypothetical protein
VIRRGADGGFALVGTLWFLALLGLVAVIIESWISGALDRAIALQDRVAARAALMGATDRAVFALANGAASARGLELVPPDAPRSAEPQDSGRNLPSNPYFVALDGRPYRLGNVTLRLQDEGGLYDLDRLSRETMLALLRSYGIPASAAERMIAALGVYMQRPPDITPRANAAANYTRAGLPRPRHAPLLTPWELYRVLGWSQAEALWSDAMPLPDVVTTGPTGGLNVDTAPAKVIGAIAGVDDQEAARVVASRSRSPIGDLRDLPGEISLREDRPLQTMPSNVIRLTLTEANDPLAHIVSIQLTPGGAAPYQIRFAVDLPRSTANEAAVPLPEPPR